MNNIVFVFCLMHQLAFNPWYANSLYLRTHSHFQIKGASSTPKFVGIETRHEIQKRPNARHINAMRRN